MPDTAVRCGQCGEPLTGKTRFCPSCGKPVASEVFDTQTVALGAPSRPPSAGSAGNRPISQTPSSARGAREGRFAPGAVLAGRYRIIALLGKGGMGEVYRAEDLTLDQPVALKFLPEGLSNHPEAAERFRNEVRTARQVSHPNVCRVYDISEIDGQYVLSMEYVDGEDLASLLRRIGRLPTDKALEIARKLCAGLAAAHEKGVLHRDLKPSNVMLDGRGQVLLTDFGLAGWAGEIEGSEIRNGTPAYMAPEQLAGEEVTIKSDIYALGLVLYEIFTGKLPFESETLAGLRRARTESNPVSPSTLVKDLDPVVERVILRCLQPKPALRPPSALAVAAALPGGDPLAAALAAGETPSPEMVAAAGEGVGLAPKYAIPLFLFVVAEMIAALVLFKPIIAQERIQPKLSPEVLTQKARDLIQRVGYDPAPADSDGSFIWDGEYIGGVESKDKAHPTDWNAVFKRPHSPLIYWYRQAEAPIYGTEIRDDLITMGTVHQSDPPPIDAGMIRVIADSAGLLLRFEAMPPEKPGPLKQPEPKPDFSPLFAEAGVDPAKLKPVDSTWNQLQAADARFAWDGEWPGTKFPLHVEAGAMRGKPVYFEMLGDWSEPERDPTPEPPLLSQYDALITAAIILVTALAAPWLTLKNIAAKRSNLRGATRLGIFVFLTHFVLWMCRTHYPLSTSLFELVLRELGAALLYGVGCWLVYMAVEPYVRRHWPQSLISWTSVLEGRFRDPIVGRDVLVGLAAAASIPLINAILQGIEVRSGGSPVLGSLAPFNGFRSTVAIFMTQIPKGVRDAMLFIFIVFLLRVLLRKQWLAGAGFGIIFTLLNAHGPVWIHLIGFSVAAIFAFIMLRFGLLAMGIEAACSNILQNGHLTTDTSAWFFAYPVLLQASVLALALWALKTSLAGQKLWKGSLLE